MGHARGIEATPTTDEEAQALGTIAVQGERRAGLSFGVVLAVAGASVFGLDPAGWFPFSVAKWWLVLFTLAVSVVAVSCSSRRRLGREPLLIALVALAAVVSLSAVVGRDGWYAWVGTPVRHLGVVAWWSFVLAAAIGHRLGITASGSEGEGDVVRAATGALVVVGLALGAFVAWESMVGRPVAYGANSDRLGGPFGSSAYLGAACCLLLPTSMGVAVDRRSATTWRIAAAMSSFGVTVALFGSGSRAAIVGVAVGFVCWGLGRSISRRPRAAWVRPAVGAGVVGSVVVSAFAVWAGVRGAFERSQGAGSRIDEWRLALRAIGRRPWLGSGPEGYRITAFELVDDDYVRTYGDEVFVDRAHSGVLDVAASSGVVAAALYLLALGIVLVAAIGLVRRPSPAGVGLAIGLIAYAVSQQFLFPIAEVDPVFWLLAGLVSARHRADRAMRRTDRSATGRVTTEPEPAPSVTASDRTVESGRSRPSRPWPVAYTCGRVAWALVAIVIMFSGVSAVAADRLAGRALEEGATVESAERDVDRARSLAPRDVRHDLLAARLAASRGTVTGVVDALSVIEDAADVSPLDPAVRIEEARLLSLLAAITGSDADRSAASDSWTALVRDAPSCRRCHRGLGRAAAERGDLDVASVAFARAADLGDVESIELLDAIEAAEN